MTWIVGLFYMTTPSGLGVREAVSVVLMQPIMVSILAILLSVNARIIWTFAELGISGSVLSLPLVKDPWIFSTSVLDRFKACRCFKD